MPLAEGTRFGPYRLGPLLGSGGMGEVYRARDERLGRDVAIKVVGAAATSDPEIVRRFEQEARAASALNHPGILAVFDLGTHDGIPYVVCELLEGQTLRERLREGPLPQRRAVEIAVQVALALAAAHEKGIVHRDLKPENLFLLRDGRAKILDFGLAKLVRNEVPSEQATGSMEAGEIGTRPGTVMGTVGYMSPEQVRGQTADHRSDIFSFGAVLYEMLSGRRAFQGTSAVETMSAILKEDPPELPADSQVALSTDRLVRRCLEKPPERRFQSASDMAFALEALSGVTRSAATAAAAPNVWSRRSVNRLLAGAGGAALVGVGYGVGARNHRAPQGEPAYKRLTFRRGSVATARFAPDGHTVVYSAAWDGGTLQLYHGRTDSPDSALIATGPANLCGVSSQGELAILYTLPRQSRTLARVPLMGGTPRDVLDGVLVADWAPDGRELAIARRVGEDFRLEYPIGKVLLSSRGVIDPIRVAPDGRRVAYVERRGGSAVVAVADSGGRVERLREGLAYVSGIAWSPAGDEVWISTPGDGIPSRVLALRLGGGERVVRAESSAMVLHDVAPDGRVLLVQSTMRSHVVFRGPGDAAERDLAWFDASVGRALSADGSLLLFDETRAASRGTGIVYLRGTDGRPPVRLSEGYSLALTPDGKWALVHPTPTSAELRLMPTSAGEPVPLHTAPLKTISYARFFPDGRRVQLFGRRDMGAFRGYVQEIGSTAAPVPLTPAGVWPAPISPDGTLITFPTAAGAVSGAMDGSEPRLVPGTVAGDVPIAWTADGRGILMGAISLFPERIVGVDLASGKRTLWKELQPADLAGTANSDFYEISADGRSYFYNFSRVLDELHVVSGLN